MVAGTAGEGDDGAQSGLFRQQDGVPEVVLKARGHVLVGMDAVAVDGQSGQLHIAALEGVEPFVKRLVVVQQDVRVGVVVARVSAAADLHGLDADGLQLLQGLLQRLLRVQVFTYADFHAGYSFQYDVILNPF